MADTDRSGDQKRSLSMSNQYFSDSEIMFLEARMFGASLMECNRLCEAELENWLFYPGMLFDSLEKWWGNGGMRPSAHEGLDICLYRTGSGQVRRLSPDTMIPAIYEGTVVRLDDDFLGKSVYVRHEICDDKGRQLFTIYGHTVPADHIRPGYALRRGEVFASIPAFEKKKVRILPHLHLSVAWIPESFPCEALDWPVLGERGNIELLNPLPLTAHEYGILKQPEYLPDPLPYPVLSKKP